MKQVTIQTMEQLLEKVPEQVRDKYDPLQLIEGIVNQLAMSGWELFSVTSFADTLLYHFGREVDQEDVNQTIKEMVEEGLGAPKPRTVSKKEKGECDCVQYPDCQCGFVEKHGHYPVTCSCGCMTDENENFYKHIEYNNERAQNGLAPVPFVTEIDEEQ